MKRLILETSYPVREGKRATSYFSWPLSEPYHSVLAFDQAFCHLLGGTDIEGFKSKIRIVEDEG